MLLRHAASMCLVLLTSLPLASGAADQSPPGLSVRAFVGDLADQNFVTLTGQLRKASAQGAATRWRCRLATSAGDGWAVRFDATSVAEDGRARWSYRLVNEQRNATVCGVTFPIVEGVRLGDSWRGNHILWPSMYVGALITDLASQDGFEKQAREACKNTPSLHGMYQGDLCLPLFVHLGEDESFGIMVLDPTHEVVSLDGIRREAGMRYEVTTHPRITSGESWSFGDIEVFRSDRADWRPAADRYREWLVAQGFSRETPPRGDVAALTYGRWDGLRPEEAIRWAKALDIKDVCLWTVLYGRGDQYYPCYFPAPELGIEGMTKKLMELRAAGLAPYFYTNGYLLSPLQTEADARAWTQRHPEQYPGWLAKGDTGYAQTVARFRAEGHEFAGDWLQTPGGILPIRVRRVSFQWGEFPVYFWHSRPFWAACVATPEWRKLFRDTARLHAELGARGIFMDQVAAMHPELCAAAGHGHDDDSFGFWNRAYLRLLRETKEAGDAVEPGFFIEAEGASDLYAKYIDRYLCNFGARDPATLRWPRLLRYTVPWARFDRGRYGYDDAGAMAEHVERTLLLGCIFRAAGGQATGEEDPGDPRLVSEAARLLRAGIAMRRRLADFMDRGRYMDDVGLDSVGCAAARWFDGERGVLITAMADTPDASVRLRAQPGLRPDAARQLDWKTGETTPAQVEREADGILAEGLVEGLNLIVIPKA